MPTTETFAKRLRLLRYHLNLSQSQLAAKCNLDDGSWSNWERGGRPRQMDVVVDAIANATGCNRMWLMWGSTTMYLSTERAQTVTNGAHRGLLSTFAQ